jgi:nicotinamidase/pyrazinamidase
MDALILVDIQNDFLPGGALAVPKGDEIIPLANRLQAYFHLIVATQDWHPADHLSFASRHKDHDIGDVIELNGLPQVLWPDHCVQGGVGAEIAASLQQTSIARVFPKGDDPGLDSYSGFFDNGGFRDTGLGAYLRSKQITDNYILGLATDYCVRATALDSMRLGFRTWLIEDACRGVELQPGDCRKAIDELVEAGVQVVSSDRWLLSQEDSRKVASRKELAKGRFLSLVQSQRWEFCQRNNATAVVVIVPITKSGFYVLIEQYREPLGRRCIEFPAGLVGDIPGEEYEEVLNAVRRELNEETGFEAEDVQFLGAASPSAGLTSEVLSFYLAKDIVQTGDGGGAEGELIQVHLVPQGEIQSWLSRRRKEGLDVALSVYGGLWMASGHSS